jgi:AcrR family transcriptional regulator
MTVPGTVAPDHAHDGSDHGQLSPTADGALARSVGTRRDRKKLATRRALRWAALDLVAERGYAHVTVEDIAEAADVSTRTFFNYFSSKEAAIVGEDPELLDLLRVALLERPVHESAFAALQAVLAEQTAHIAEERSAHISEADRGSGDLGEWLRRMKAVHADPELRVAHAAHMARLERVIAEAIAERLGTDIEADPYPTVLAAAAMAVTRVTLMHWAKSGAVGSPETLTNAAFAALAAGLADDGQLASALAELRTSSPTPIAGTIQDSSIQDSSIQDSSIQDREGCS